MVSDGQTSIRRAVERALPGVPHQLCQFHFLREAALPVFEADRHAKVALKKPGCAACARSSARLEGRDDAEAEVVRGYCAAVRSAITDDGRPPLAASGLRLKARLEEVADSLDRVAAKGGGSPPLARLRRLIGRGLEGTAALWPDVERAYGWVHRAAHILSNAAGRGRHQGPAPLRRPAWPPWPATATRPAILAEAIEHFCKVARSYRPGLFHCYAVPGLPRTDNGLEQLFGSQRYHERRATGRKAASPAAVLRGEVRLIAATATRLRPPAARELGRVSRDAWRELRRRLEPEAPGPHPAHPLPPRPGRLPGRTGAAGMPANFADLEKKEGSMSTLVLELRQGDVMVVNGAPIRFRNRTRIELAARARFLFGKQVMPPEAANTPARRIYFALQTAYVGTDEEREGGLAAARRLIADFQEATTSTLAREMLARALAFAEADDCYQALKLARRVMTHEQEVLGLPALAPARAAAGAAG